MKRQRVYSLLVLGLILSAATETFAQDTSFVGIDYPGATGTQAWGINARGDIIGLYTLADKSTRGFLLRNGTYSSIDYPGAAVTLANGINPQGDIVGEYGLTLTDPHHGFLLRGGKYTTLDFPGAVSTSPTGINSRGDIAGIYTTAGNVSHSFLLSGDRFTTIDYYGAAAIANGITSTGDVVGGNSVAGVAHACIWKNGQPTCFDYPGAAGFTNATGANPRGDIVGRYRGADGASHGYLLSGGKFTTIDVPGATFTGLTGITPAGDLIGRQTTAGVNHGFLVKKKAGRYVITDLGPMGPAGQPFGLTDGGIVAGFASAADGSQHGFLWQKGVRTDVGTLGIGISNSIAFGVNEQGQAVGASDVWGRDPNSEDFCGFKTLGFPSWGNSCLPFLRQNGVMTPLPRLGGNNAVASWINARGDIAGWSENDTPDPGCPAPQKLQFKPVLWQNGKIQELPTVGGDPNGVVVAVNDSGQAVGASGSCTVFSPQLFYKLQALHAVIWQDGMPTDLGNLGGTGRAFGITALGINSLGQVVGNSDLRGDKVNHAFLWTKQTGMQDMGTLPGDVNSAGISINDRGEVVGVSLDGAFNLRAYHWQAGKMEDLNDLVAGDTSLYLVLGVIINAGGEITGLAFDTKTNELHGFLATPVSGDAGGDKPSLASRRPALTDAHRGLIQQQLAPRNMGPWLAPSR